MTATKDHIKIAHEITTKLEAAGITGPEAGTVLSMALGIMIEAEPGAHRELRPLLEGMIQAAQITFDAMRLGRKPGERGHA